MKTKFVFIFTAMLAMGLFVIVSCEGPMGPQGPPGEQGPPGPVGPAGSDGSIIHAGQGAPEGDTGNPGDFYLDLITGNLFGPKMAEGWGAPFSLVGAKGPEGPRGPAGPQGPRGPEGPQGPAGEDGQDGERGPQGPAGEDGQDGQDGEQGPQGPSGEDGQNGEDGEQGPQGPQGPEGPQGPAGEDGQDGQDGEDGKDGKDGSQIYAGNGAPDSSQGAEGDYYLDKTNYELYGPKTGSGWGTPISLQGPQGEQGEQGPQGPEGSPAFLDIQYVEAEALVTTDNETSTVSLGVDCPDGYNVLGGGAGPTFNTAVNISRWFIASSRPRLTEDAPSIEFDGWTAVFETVDGEDAEGTYGFNVKAICAKMD